MAESRRRNTAGSAAEGDLVPAEGDMADRLEAAGQRIAELEGLLAEHIERERILEVEMAAMRRDLDVKVTYCDVLEATAEERKRYLEWLQSNYDTERRRAGALAAELTAERARLSYRLTRKAVGLIRRG